MTITPAQVSGLIEITEGDSSRLLYDTLTLAGQYIPLSGSTVTLHWYDPVSGSLAIKSANIVSAVSGSVSYQLTSDDVADAGVKLLQWNVSFPSGKQLRLPTGKYLKLNIIGDLED